jgi:hypothetical protein
MSLHVASTVHKDRWQSCKHTSNEQEQYQWTTLFFRRTHTKHFKLIPCLPCLGSGKDSRRVLDISLCLARIHIFVDSSCDCPPSYYHFLAAASGLLIRCLCEKWLIFVHSRLLVTGLYPEWFGYRRHLEDQLVGCLHVLWQRQRRRDFQRKCSVGVPSRNKKTMEELSPRGRLTYTSIATTLPVPPREQNIGGKRFIDFLT